MPQAPPIDDRLNALRELALPEAVSYAPQTAGWYFLFAAAAAGLAWLAIRSYLQWKANRYRRVALERLRSINEASQSDPSAVAELPELVKRTALAFSARTEAAELYGADWLAFLDSTYGGAGFSTGPGRVLPSLAYGASPSLGEADRTALVSLVDEWIRKHHARV